MSYLLTLFLLLGQVSADDAASPEKSKPDAKQPPAAKQPTATPSPEPMDEELEEEESSGASKVLDDILSSGAIGQLRKGGFFMWPILILGVIAFGVIIERYRSLKMLSADSSAIRSEVQEHLQADRVEEALEYCDREQGPVPAILSAGLRKFLLLRRLDHDPAKIETDVVKAMDDYGVHVVAALEKHLPILATISSIAPMLGFLGTVAGMIVSFEDIVANMGETNIVESAAGGISVALLTTAFGLIVGIPTFMAFNYFTGVINRFVLDVEESATELIEVVTLQMALDRQGGSFGDQAVRPALADVASGSDA